MAYKITDACIQCGVCVEKCPAGAFIADEEIVEFDGAILRPVTLDPAKCTDCGECVAYEWWCPAKAVIKV
jgi:ferredoxin